MIGRDAMTELQQLAQIFKAVAVVGPRQAGKTTLVRHAFPDKPYVSLENPDIRLFAEEDPRGFLAQYPAGAVLDEAQRAPLLFSFLQQLLDEHKEKGQFILTGSNNFLLQENISQSLAGRIGYLFLLPFSMQELKQAGKLPHNVNEMMFRGCYPPIYDQEIAPERWYPNYLRTYVERDVRQIKNISNLGAFERFLKLCAGRIGQLLNLSSIGIEVGVDHKTIASWISVLETSFIIYLLRPHHQNFNKRVVKMPKLYFYDTGLVCSLLGIQMQGQLEAHPLRGNLFENLIISDLVKARYNRGNTGHLYFWRDNTGNEIDVIIDKGTTLYPVEIKAGSTVTSSYFKSLEFWKALTQTVQGTVVYSGNHHQKRSSGNDVLPWDQVDSLVHR